MTPTLLLNGTSFRDVSWEPVLIKDSSVQLKGRWVKIAYPQVTQTFFCRWPQSHQTFAVPQIGRRCMVVLNISNLLMFRVYLVFHFSSHSRFG